MIVSVVGITLALPVVGILALADTVLADVYLAGHKDVSAAMILLSGGSFSNRIIAYFGVFLLISLIEAIAYAVAVGSQAACQNGPASWSRRALCSA